jgi:uncharacterized BrkB/YihY/UPF0761 family membrane protein
MIGKAWVLIKDTVSGFIEHEDLSRGAAITYYTIFSIAPLLIIVIAIAGLVFGHDAASALSTRGHMPKPTAATLPDNRAHEQHPVRQGKEMRVSPLPKTVF